jgi:putative aldouronate transport system permease protein
MNMVYGKGVGGAQMSKKIKVSIGDRIFTYINYTLLILLCFTALYPFLYLLSVSFSPNNSLNLESLSLIPKEIDLSTYRKVLTNENIARGFISTFKRLALGTPLTIIATVIAAYPLSKKYFPHRSFWTAIIVFTMFFGGGLIPTYLWMKQLGLMDNIWAITLPGMIATYNMIIVRNFFMALPESLEESARIDGANDLIILFNIIIPVSMPIIATIALWTMVGHWNAWFDSLIYIRDVKKQVLQVVLRAIVLEGTQEMMNMSTGLDDISSVSPDSLKAATIMVATIPILLVYPFLQKYFVKGIMVGSLKG